MLKFVSRAVAAIGAAVVLLAPSFSTPTVQAQAVPTPEPPLQIIIGTASLGNLAAAAALLNNRTNGRVSLADLRCAFSTAWTFVDGWAGDGPNEKAATVTGTNRGRLSRQMVPGPDGELAEYQVIGWINLNIDAFRAQGPFIYVFNTNGRSGMTWCNVTAVFNPLNLRAFTRNITSDTFVFTAQ
jgi:hypothetical protein